jgi:ABC-type branched-subunit amino acid transport system permease subunit
MTSVSTAATPVAGGPAVRVTRSRRRTTWLLLVAVAAVAVLGYLPYLVFSGTTNLLVNVFILITMASMWNLLAGYAGLVSVGQQAFVGLGAYFVLLLAQHGVNPFVALPVAVFGCAVLAVPVWWLVSRLRTAYFAIASWVVASVCYLLIVRFPSLGGGTGAHMPGLDNVAATLLGAYTYWAALAVTLVVVAAAYLILRSRIGLGLTAVRDDEIGARSSGVRVAGARRFVFVVAGAGCGAAGTLLIISQQTVDPTAVFSVSLSAQMIFATLIGGIGTIEGPIIGAVIFFVLQQWLQNYGTWYFMILGAVAIGIAIWARRGLWGLVADRLNLRVFPVGYYLWPGDDAGPRRGGFPLRRKPAPAAAAPPDTGSESS